MFVQSGSVAEDGISTARDGSRYGRNNIGRSDLVIDALLPFDLSASDISCWVPLESSCSSVRTCSDVEARARKYEVLRTDA